MMKIFFHTCLLLFSLSLFAQQRMKPGTGLPAEPPYISRVWVADLGNGMYRNPVLNADYSDPDAIRVGDDFYLVSSSFEDIPGLPILHSRDLVNWTLIGHALLRQPPFEVFAKPQHGNGVWAPAIRYHKGEFYIYYPDPDYGIYLVKARNAAGPWSDPVLVEGGKGLIDPCPLWDDDGHELDPTFEGPKLYKRNGYYYIFAPAGGVTTGWQLVLRSKNIYGPYERKVVMDQGSTAVIGPHQGAWVTTKTGEDWFLHFQDKGPYGRVMHLQPMKWLAGWPVIGAHKDRGGKGEPVLYAGIADQRFGVCGCGLVQGRESRSVNCCVQALQTLFLPAHGPEKTYQV